MKFENKQKWVLFSVVCTMVFMYSVILYLPSPLITQISEETGWSLGQTGNFMGIFNFFTGICTFFTTPLVDRFGTKRTAAISLVLAVLGGFAAAVGGMNYYIHCIGRMLSGAGFGIMFPVPGTIISEIFPPEKASRMLGIRTTIDFTGCSLSYYITLPIYHLLHSWQYTFAVWGFVAVIPLILLTIAAKRGTRQEKCQRKEDYKRSGKSSWGIALRQKWMWLIAIAMIGVNMPLYGFSTYLPTYLQLDKGLSLSAASAVTGLIQIAGIFSGVISGMITEWLGRRKVLGCGSLLCILSGSVLVLFTPYIILISAGAFIIGFAVGAYMIYYSTVPADILKGEQPGVYAAAISLTLGSGTIFTVFIPGVFQFILDHGMSIKTALIIFVLPAAVSLIPVCMVKETGPKGKDVRAGQAPYQLCN